jgi:hypothetical protein
MIFLRGAGNIMALSESLGIYMIDFVQSLFIVVFWHLYSVFSPVRLFGRMAHRSLKLHHGFLSLTLKLVWALDPLLQFCDHPTKNLPCNKKSWISLSPYQKIPCGEHFRYSLTVKSLLLFSNIFQKEKVSSYWKEKLRPLALFVHLSFLMGTALARITCGCLCIQRYMVMSSYSLMTCCLHQGIH